jgi:hypothetical protein
VCRAIGDQGNDHDHQRLTRKELPNHPTGLIRSANFRMMSTANSRVFSLLSGRHMDVKTCTGCPVDGTDARCRTIMISCGSRCKRLDFREELRPTGDPTLTPRSPSLGALEVSLVHRRESRGDGLPRVISDEPPQRRAPPRVRAGGVAPHGGAAT